MNTHQGVAPEFMTAAIQDLCNVLSMSHKMTLDDSLVTLERLCYYCSGRIVCYTIYTLENGSSDVQIYPRSLHDRTILEATYFVQKGFDAVESLDELLYTIASLTVLLVASEEVVRELSPDTRLRQFWQAHTDGMRLVCAVQNALRSVVITG